MTLYKNKPLTKFSYRLRNKDNRIEIKVTDIFEEPGSIVVPVNDCFDMCLNGNVMKANSIQSQVIKKYYSGKYEHLESDISAKVNIGNKHSIGKTIETEQQSKKFYLVVNSKKKENCRVESEIDDFILTLNGLWEYIAYESSRDKQVNIPVISTQHGRETMLTRMTAVKEIVASYIEHSKTRDICERLTICIHPDDIDRFAIDLDELNEYLKFTSKHYRSVVMEKTSGDNKSRVTYIEN